MVESQGVADQADSDEEEFVKIVELKELINELTNQDAYFGQNEL